MLKYLTLALLLAITARLALAQTAPISSSTTGKYQYCTLAGTLNAGSNAYFDYGQNVKAAPANPAMDELAKKVRELGSPVLALSYLLGNGWEYVGVTALAPYSVIYLIRKRTQ